MASMMKITGARNLLNNIRKAHKGIVSNATRGLVIGGQFLQAESMRICPVMTGNLRSSAFTRKYSPKLVIVGYTAAYAMFVHENLQTAHGKAFNVKHAAEIARANARMASGNRRSRVFFNRGENQQAKFLETPLKKYHSQILKIIAREASKKP